MADAFSLAFRVDATHAILAGRDPSWQPRTWIERCGGPPETSDWGPCPAGAGAGACERGTGSECENSCGDTSVQECAWDCSDWLPCDAGIRTVAFAACDDVRLVGGASCSGSPAVVQLVDGLGQERGLFLSEPVVVGGGSVVINATARAGRASTEPCRDGSGYGCPGDGWAIVVYRGGVGSQLGSGGDNLGVVRTWKGYSVEWIFYNRQGWSQGDVVKLRAINGSASEAWESERIDGAPPLDQATDPPVQQSVRMTIEPDDPDTPDNEMSVTASLRTGPDLTPIGPGCAGDECCPRDNCDAPVRPGDTLQVALTSATGAFQANVQVDAPEGLSVQISPCR
jgi:hypothetical protein